MPVSIHCKNLPISPKEVETLWSRARDVRQYPDEEIGLRCVSVAEIQRLNKMYLGKNRPTNVLTFSYGKEHDIALCLSVARRQAPDDFSSYVALLIVHAFLHVTGMDHTTSKKAWASMLEAEEKILRKAGFRHVSW